MFLWQKNRKLGIALGLALLGAAMGCSSAKTMAKSGEEAVAERDWDAAVFQYLQALTEEPSNIEYRMQLGRARQKASQQHLNKGMSLRALGRLYNARDELEMAAELDPANQYAEQTLKKVENEIEISEGPGGMADLEAMKAKAREAKVKPPVLDPTSKEPITLKFPQPKPVKEIYEALGKAYGFNVLFDPKLKNDKLSVELNDVTAERALEIVLQAAGDFYKVLDPHSIIIVEDTPQNRRDYEDLVIKTFFLSNAEVKDVDKLLRALIEARRLSTNEQLNSITLRDTADKVAIAEKLIEVNDKAKAEVVIDVELMLVSSNEDSNLGTELSTLSYTLQLDTAAIRAAHGITSDLGGLPLNIPSGISSANTFVNIPTLTMNLMKASGRSEVLANPELRVTEGEKAKLHIGDKYPIPVTSFNTANLNNSNVVPMTSFQYQDIGIKIDVEPRVHHNREVTLKLKVEVSNIGGTVTVGQNQEAKIIGTRNIDSVIRLKNGETSMLAGLFRNDKTETNTETPGLSKIPLLGRLFKNKKKHQSRTDLVLTLTPHIVRFPSIRDEDLAPLWVGTESKMSYYGSNRPRVASGRSSTGPFDRRGEGSGPDRDSRKRPVPRTSSSGSDARKPPAFGSRAVTPAPKPPRGVNLVPAPGKKSLEMGDEEAVGAEKPELNSKPAEISGSPGADGGGEIDFEAAPVLVNLQPSVLSMTLGREAEIEIVASGQYGAYQLPLGLSFDPEKIRIESVEGVDGASILKDSIDGQEGWMHLVLVVPDGDGVPQSVAKMKIRSLKPGPVPLMFTTEGVRISDGRRVPASASNGALFITADAGVPAP